MSIATGICAKFHMFPALIPTRIASETSLRPWPRSAPACQKMGPARDPFDVRPSRPPETWWRRYVERCTRRAMGISRPGFAEGRGHSGRTSVVLSAGVIPRRVGTPTAGRTDRLSECMEVNLSGFSEERCSEPHEPSARADGPPGDHPSAGMLMLEIPRAGKARPGGGRGARGLTGRESATTIRHMTK